MRTGAGLYLFLATHLSMLSDVKAYTEYKDHDIIRYRYGYEDDYTIMNSWEDARDYCISKGYKLPTWTQLCPDGKGPFKSPVGGMIEGQNWVAVEDDVERFVDAGRQPYSCSGDGCRSCRGHVQHHGGKEGWGFVGGSKQAYFNNQVFCHVEPTPNPTLVPTPNPTLVPTSSPTALIEGNVGNGCINTIKISHSYVNSMMSSPCDKCAFCAGSSLNDILNPDINSMCVICVHYMCNSLRVITSFNTPWVMKYFPLSASEMSVDSDPAEVVLEGSNNLQDWTSLYDTSKLTSFTFGSRSESEDFVFSHNTVPYKHYAITFVRNGDNAFSKMHVGHYGIVESYTKQCAANIFNDITGNDVVPYKEVV